MRGRAREKRAAARGLFLAADGEPELFAEQAPALPAAGRGADRVAGAMAGLRRQLAPPVPNWRSPASPSPGMM